jgi:hypothetical protein
MSTIPNVNILLDELRKAEEVASPDIAHYSRGYLDGLRMALSIVEGRVE